MSNRYVLDTSALMTLLEKESGADQVDAILMDAVQGNALLYGCFASLTEVEYTALQEEDEQFARQRLIDLRAFPIRWVHSDEALCAAAAKLKAAHRISFADVFVAATAMRLDATLIHKDPEFLPLAPSLKQLVLPPKGGAQSA